MSQVVIENPIINSPFEAPARHFRFDEQGITNTIVPERRISQYFVPIAKPRKTVKERQLTFDEWTEDRIEENKTIRDTYKTRADRCHVSHVVGDTKSWEQKMAQTLEDMDEVCCYAKNHGLGFLIPYTIGGVQRNYVPDFIATIDDGHGPDDPLKLIIEVTGAKDKDKEAKVAAAQTLWVPAVNNAGTWGRWAFVEIRDPWDAKNQILSHRNG